MLQYNETGGGVLVHHAGSFSRNSSGGTVITRQGFLKGEGIFPTVNVNRKNGKGPHFYSWALKLKN
ncbi:unnamed protein product [Strongylus vulgaris]|uniref:Uncharacterized protein n=1 Tax=Strongylus vulgaris TaxID=40348 RepID=A0A3P7M2M6_STRVU|nr:unnamed protein product [Strongylus vulgaris]